MSLIGTPKIAEQDPKMVWKTPKQGSTRNKMIALYFQNKKKIRFISLCKNVPKMVLNLIRSPKIASKDPIGARKAPNGAELETKG